MSDERVTDAGPTSRYTDADLVGAVAEALDQSGGRFLSRSAYEAFRARQLKAGRTLPAASTIARRCGWTAAQAAGLPKLEWTRESEASSDSASRESMERVLGVFPLLDDPRANLSDMAMLIALSVRNTMEDFHVANLSDDQMAALNPLIRQGIFEALTHLRAAGRPRSPDHGQAFQALMWWKLTMPVFWEPPSEGAHRDRD